MASEAYEELGGGTVEYRWPPAYNEGLAITKPCRDCGAHPMDLCVNPINGLPKRCPCRVRIIRPAWEQIPAVTA
jgi:hypothetical protein